jgi:hypothetical protein
MKRKKNFQQFDDDKVRSPKNPLKDKSTKNLKRSLFDEIEDEEDFDYYYKDDDDKMEDYFDDDEEELEDEEDEEDYDEDDDR